MRVKISVTLPEELLERIDREIGIPALTSRVERRQCSRSMFIEKAARLHLASIERKRRDAHDLAIIHAHADRLNAEAVEALDYQVQL